MCLSRGILASAASGHTWGNLPQNIKVEILPSYIIQWRNLTMDKDPLVSHDTSIYSWLSLSVDGGVPWFRKQVFSLMQSQTICVKSVFPPVFETSILSPNLKRSLHRLGHSKWISLSSQILPYNSWGVQVRRPHKHEIRQFKDDLRRITCIYSDMVEKWLEFLQI